MDIALLHSVSQSRTTAADFLTDLVCIRMVVMITQMK
jgi:hypothetical protein